MLTLNKALHLIKWIQFSQDKFDITLSFNDYIRSTHTQLELKKSIRTDLLKKNMRAVASKTIDSILEILTTLNESLSLDETELSDFIAQLNDLKNEKPWDLTDDSNLILIGAQNVLSKLEGLLDNIKSNLDQNTSYVKVRINELLISVFSSKQAIDVKTGKSLSQLLSMYDSNELKNLVVQSIKNNPELVDENLTNLGMAGESRLFIAMINQHKLNTLLNNLGFSIQVDIDTPLDNCQRIVLTNKNVLNGLELISTYIKNNPKQSLEKLTAEMIIDSFLGATHGAGHVNFDHSGFELSWGLLSSLIKHNKNDLFATTSIELAKMAISKLEKPNTTLVFDGHGKILRINLADFEQSLIPREFGNILGKLIAVDTKRYIDHVILQTCASGLLAPEYRSELYTKPAHQPGKIRQVLVHNRSSSPFEKVVSDNQSRDSVAEAAYLGLGDRREDVAFTFSENLINPGNQLSEGNIGKEIPSGRESASPLWQEEIRADNFSPRNVVKSQTIVPEKEHRKFKRDRFFKVVSPVPVDENISEDFNKPPKAPQKPK